MTPEQAAAYLMAQAACAYAEIAGMAAENQASMLAGETPRYRYDDFMKVPEALGIHHNAAMTLFQSING